MKRLSLLGVAVFVIVILIAVSVVFPGIITPRFAGFGSCENAGLVIYNGDYNSLKNEVTLDVRNQGQKTLSLEAFITTQGKTTKHSKVIYLSPGGKGTFTLEDVTEKPQEVTLRDRDCGVADLWKF